jgi:hypothetical protein
MWKGGGSSPGADVAGVSPVPVQMWQGRVQSPSPVRVQMWEESQQPRLPAYLHIPIGGKTGHLSEHCNRGLGLPMRSRALTNWLVPAATQTRTHTHTYTRTRARTHARTHAYLRTVPLARPRRMEQERIRVVDVRSLDLLVL